MKSKIKRIPIIFWQIGLVVFGLKNSFHIVFVDIMGGMEMFSD